jgi:hypothetical protein
VVTNAILGATLVALLLGLALFYRYSRTDAFRRGELRKASFELLLIIGPYFGVHPKRPQPQPTTISTPRDDPDDPLAGRATVSTPETRDPGEERRPPQL